MAHAPDRLFVFVIVGAVALTGCGVDGRDDPSLQPPGAARALGEWAAQRAYPGDDVPANATFAAAEWAQHHLPPERVAKSTDAAQWRTLGPHNIGGRTLSVVVSPHDPNVVYAGSASGGLWRSTTGGLGPQAWQRVPIGHPALAVSSIALAPDDPDTFYIGTGEVYGYRSAEIFGRPFRSMRGSFGIGVLKTSDGGATFVRSLDWSAEQQRGVQAVKIDPTDSDNVWAATTEGVFKSSNGGATWDLVLDVLMATDLVISTQNGSTVVVACGNFSSDDKGLYRTTDGGATWDLVWDGLNPDFQGKIQLAVSPSAPTTVFASVGSGFTVNDPSEFTRLMKSGDFGLNWTVVSTVNYARYQGWYSHDVAVSPTNTADIVAVGFYVWRSTTGGQNLVQKSSFNPYGGQHPPGAPEGPPDYVHPDIHDVVYHPTIPGLLYFATDGGVYRSSDGGETFEGCNGGYQTAQFYAGFSSSPSDDDFAMGGLQDNGTAIYLGSTTWSSWHVGGDGAWTGIDPRVGGPIYASAQYLALHNSFDGGMNWYWIGPGSDERPTCFVAPYVLGPSDPDVLYAARDLVFRSNDGGGSWNITNGGAALDGNPMLTLAISHQSDDVVYAASAPSATRAGVFATRNGGTTWDDVTGTLPDRFPADLAVDPVDDLVVYVAFSGFGTSHLFRSVNGGAGWQDLGTGLPDVPTSAVVVDPGDSTRIYVGTDIGIFASDDGGTTWTDFNAGLTEPVAVLDLVITPTRLLRAATHGNGAFERELPELPLFADGFESGDTTVWSVSFP